MEDKNDPKHVKESPPAFVPYWHNTLPEPVVQAMRHMPAYPLLGTERAADHTLRIEIPALADGLSPKEQLATLHAMQKIIDMFAEKFDYGNKIHEPNSLMHNLSGWREQRKHDHSHVRDYDYLLILSLSKFQQKLNVACAQLEDHKPANIPLPHMIEIALSHGYHAASQPEEVTLELQALHGTLWMLLSAAEQVCDRDMPQSQTLQKLCVSLKQATQDADYFCSVEQGVQHKLESLLVQGDTTMTPSQNGPAMHVAYLLERIKDQGRSS